MLKKVFALLLAVSVVFSLSGCSNVLGGGLFPFLVAAGDDRADKDTIFAFVCENEEKLLEAIEAGELSAYENKGFIKEINADERDVDFACGGAGVGGGTAYVGFFYTPENDMAAVWCAPSSASALTPSGDGFAWQERNGDNQYYTEHICGNFYYYEASF